MNCCAASSGEMSNVGPSPASRAAAWRGSTPRLAPSGALHHEDTSPIADERLDRFTLMRPEVRVGPPGQPTQRVEQFIGLARRTHSGPLCRRGVSTAPDDGVPCCRSLWRHHTASGQCDEPLPVAPGFHPALRAAHPHRMCSAAVRRRYRTVSPRPPAMGHVIIK